MTGPRSSMSFDRVRHAAGTLKHRTRRGAHVLSWVLRTPKDRQLTAARHLRGPYRRVYLVHVQKTGGTSLEKAFYGLGGEDPAVVEQRFRGPVTIRSGGFVYSVTPSPFFIRHAQYFFASSHVPYWRYRLPPGTFTVTMLRDPCARVLSRYRQLRDPSTDAGHLFAAGENERAWARQGLVGFLDRVPDDQLLAQLWMFSPSFDPAEAAVSIRQMSLYFFTEWYELGLPALGEAIGVDLPVRHDRGSPTQSVGDEDLVALRARLEPEYRLLDLLRADPGPGYVGPPTAEWTFGSRGADR